MDAGLSRFVLVPETSWFFLPVSGLTSTMAGAGLMELWIGQRMLVLQVKAMFELTWPFNSPSKGHFNGPLMALFGVWCWGHLYGW